MPPCTAVGLARIDPALTDDHITCEHDVCGDVDLRTVILGAAHSHLLPLPRLVGGHSPCSRNWMDQRCINGPQTQRPPYPAAQVLGWLFECERTQVSHSFALLKQVRWWDQRRGILSIDASGLRPRLLVRRMRSFVSFLLKP